MSAEDTNKDEIVETSEVLDEASESELSETIEVVEDEAIEPAVEPAVEPEPETTPEPKSKMKVKSSKSQSEPEVESSDDSVWAAWAEYPGIDAAALALTSTCKFNSLVTASLLAHGFGTGLERLGIDGNWWTSNIESLSKFQNAYDLGETGLVGPNTWAKLGSKSILNKIQEIDGLDELKAGEKSDKILLLHALLILNGHGDGLLYSASREWRAESILALALSAPEGK